MTKLSYYISIFLFVVICFSHQQSVAFEKSEKLTEQEKNIVIQVNKELPTTIEKLKQSVNINSGTMNFMGVKAVGKLMIQQFEALGMQVDWLEGSSFNRAGHVVAQFQSNNPTAKNILMIGHLDTVFAKNDDFQTYQQLSETKAAGPGITDMKGGNAIIIASLSALKNQGLLKDINIRVVMTGDEESSGRPLSLSKKAIVDGGKWADIALGFEDGDGNIKTGIIARRGYTGWTLNITAKPAHSSQIFREDIGYGAVFEAARILNSFRTRLSSEENLTFNPGVIAGGTTITHDKEHSSITSFGKSNVIAQTLTVSGDLRALTPEQVSDAKKEMQAIVNDNLAHTQAVLNFENGYPPMSPTEGNKALLTMYNQVSEDLGHGGVIAANPRKAGAADISFAAEHVEMALDGMGLMGQGGHTKDEVADLTSLKKNIEKTAILLHRLSLK